MGDNGHDLFDFYRAHGAARQVAAEGCALARRGALDAIAALYKDDGDGSDLDLDCWNVSLEFDGYSADVNSVWGLGYAQSKAAQEAALQVAWEMETNGYTLTGKPDLHARRFTLYRERLKANIGVQNWNA